MLELTAEIMNSKNSGLMPRFNVIAICDQGEAVIEHNMEKVTISKGMRMLGSSVMHTKCVSVTADFHAWVLAVTEEFARDEAVGIPTEMLTALFRHPSRLVTNEKEWKILNNFMENIWLYDQMECGHSAEIAGTIFRSIISLMAEIEMKENPQNLISSSYTMADTYFRKFISLVDKNVDKEHEVSFYASQLSITPKYLSEICKQKSGRKAKEIISGILIAKIKRDITVSGKSMKMLAYEYCFADQSSLGKFFRKMTGQSPSTFKKNAGLAINDEED